MASLGTVVSHIAYLPYQRYLPKTPKYCLSVPTLGGTYRGTARCRDNEVERTGDTSAYLILALSVNFPSQFQLSTQLKKLHPHI